MESLIFILYKFAGGLVTPPGCFFALLFPSLLWGFFKTGERAIKRLNLFLLFLIATMYFLFMPLTAAMLMGVLEVERPILPDDDLPTLVAVLAGGGTHPIPGSAGELELAEQSYQRLAEGVKIANAGRWALLYSGAYDEGDIEAYKRSIQRSASEWGFQGEVLLDAVSRTTWENLTEIAKIVNERGFERVVLSTTAYHMRRVLWMARKQIPDNAEIVPWPSGWRSARDRLTINALAPSARAFYDSCTALRELVGLAAYKFLK